jgi:hypothetical protein
MANSLQRKGEVMKRTVLGALFCLISTASTLAQEGYDLRCHYRDGSGTPFFVSGNGKIQATVTSALATKGYEIHGEAVAFAKMTAKSTAGQFCFLMLDLKKATDDTYTYEWNRRIGAASPCESYAQQTFIEVDRNTLAIDLIYEMNGKGLVFDRICEIVQESEFESIESEISSALALLEPPAPPTEPKI